MASILLQAAIEQLRSMILKLVKKLGNYFLILHPVRFAHQDGHSVLIDEEASKTGDLYIRSVCFSPDGKFLATGAEDKQIRVSLLIKPVKSSSNSLMLDLGYR